MPFDGDVLCIVDEAVDHRHDAGSVREDIVPIGKITICCRDDGALCLIASADEFEEEVGMAVGV